MNKYDIINGVDSYRFAPQDNAKKEQAIAIARRMFYRDELWKGENYHNMIDDMTDSERRELNIFLSNFSETGFSGYNQDYNNNEELITFAYVHYNINKPDAIYYKDSKMGISASDVDKV